MNWDAADYIKAANEAPAEKKEGADGDWLAENVWAPFVNGSGVIQQYNNFTDNNVALLKQGPATLGSAEWAVQTISGVAGAIGPYLIAGKVAGKALGSVAEHTGARGFTARALTNSGVANVVGATIYDFAKEPLEGETRTGTAMGSAAGFTVFEVGNHFIKGTGGMFGSTTTRLLGQNAMRFGVGAAGGLATYETSQSMDGLLGARDDRTMHGRFEHAISGGFLNVALPAMHNGVTKAVDYGYNSRSYGPGVPIQRFLANNHVTDVGVWQTAQWNPLARVKIATDGVTKADVTNNVIHVPKDAAPGKLAHELRHLRVASELEPHYRGLAETVKIDPTRAENQFMNMRAYAEFQARMMEGLVNSKTSAESLATMVENASKIGEQIASNGKTYRENWQAEWQQLQADPKFRPQFEYSGKTEPAAPKVETMPVADSAKPAEAKPAEVSRDIRVTDAKALGKPDPLGATVTETGTNFAVRSQGANKVELLIFGDGKVANESSSMQTLAMNRTGDVWHRFVEGKGHGTEYLYRAFGDYNPAVDGTRFNGNMALLDPYSKAITGDTNRPVAYDNTNPADPHRHLRPGDVDAVKDMSRSVAVESKFDWQGDKHPNTPMTDSIIYEMHVKGFTGGIEELGHLRGTYRGLVEKIPHLKRLGVTAVELMPVNHFEKVDNFNGTMGEVPRNPVTGEPLRNQWGYQTIGYQAPEASYAADGRRGQQVNEFKYMVRELHKNNIEVILDVVFNHTAEDGHLGPTISFRGLDNKVYYMLAPNAPDKYIDHTGCRNTLNVNEPAVQNLILDSLKYWVKEMHVDGFRFDLATVFNYDTKNVDQARTPVLERITSDPDLAHIKLIAEPWSIDQYKVGRFWDTRWGEWNGVFRDTVRKFLKSDSGQLSDLAERITGSRRWFDAQQGRHSVNFVTAHDGFTLNDLVSYNQKHNFQNGEGNRDGANDNYSWNHGVEGPVHKHNLPEHQAIAIEALRNRQVKNAFAMMFLSQGTPMMLSGDEFRRTTDGNNNYWNQEKLNQLDWSLMDKHPDVVRFVENMTKLRNEFQIGRRTPEQVKWHGTQPNDQSFSNDARYIAWELPPTEAQPKRLYNGFNSYWEPLEITLPEGKWRRRVDTNLPQGQDIVGAGEGPIIEGGKYIVQPRTGVVFESVP